MKNDLMQNVNKDKAENTPSVSNVLSYVNVEEGSVDIYPKTSDMPKRYLKYFGIWEYVLFVLAIYYFIYQFDSGALRDAVTPVIHYAIMGLSFFCFVIGIIFWKKQVLFSKILLASSPIIIPLVYFVVMIFLSPGFY